MQQYFIERQLALGEEYLFTGDAAHHAKNVVRLHNETVRLVYHGQAWLATAYQKDGSLYAHVDKVDERVNEIGCDVILCMALIRREKMELVLQKAAELGVSGIVPFVSSRCVVKEKKEKSDKLRKRWESILQEAAEQCKRNQIPTLFDTIAFDKLKDVQAQVKLAAYENAYGSSKRLYDVLEQGKSTAFVIGPEGGFSSAEVEQLQSFGYQPVTLGKRILRAETAAIAACALTAEFLEK